jgi:molybdopterin-guanine dinucleotide biosynthesis protein A
MANESCCDSVLGVVLAGGLSRRFLAGDKAFQRLAGRTLAERVVERASPQVARLIISANGDIDRYGTLGADAVIVDHRPDREGPLAGVEAAIDWLEREEMHLPWVASFPVDGPFAPEDLVIRLLAFIDGREVPAVASCQGHAHPTFGIWPVAVAGELRAYLALKERGSIMSFVESLNGVSVPFEARTPNPFFNINTREDLARAEALVRP